MGQYKGVNCRPYVCAPVQLIATPKTTITRAQSTSPRKGKECLKKSPTPRLDLAQIKVKSIRVVVVFYASIVAASSLRSHPGYVKLMARDNPLANIVQHGPSRRHRFTTSLVAAEVPALIPELDSHLLIRDALNELLRKGLEIEALVGSRALFNVVTKNGNTTERRLPTDVVVLKQTYGKEVLKRAG